MLAISARNSTAPSAIPKSRAIGEGRWRTWKKCIGTRRRRPVFRPTTGQRNFSTHNRQLRRQAQQRAWRSPRLQSTMKTTTRRVWRKNTSLHVSGISMQCAAFGCRFRKLPMMVPGGHAHVVLGRLPCGHGWSRQPSWASVYASWLNGSLFAGEVSGFPPVTATLGGDMCILRLVSLSVWSVAFLRFEMPMYFGI